MLPPMHFNLWTCITVPLYEYTIRILAQKLRNNTRLAYQVQENKAIQCFFDVYSRFLISLNISSYVNTGACLCKFLLLCIGSASQLILMQAGKS